MSKVKEDTAKVDNTAVVKPKVFERLRVTPREYELVDLGGTPSNDTRTPAERNKDYLHPIKGAKERFKASMSNETNPLVGIERTILPSAAGAALVTTPITLVRNAGYGYGIDNLTGGWGNMVERTTGIPSEIAKYTNPGAIIGGAAGYRLDQKNLLPKFIKGDADLAWNPINKNHWIFNKEARTVSNIGRAVTNRLAPFLQGAEKLNGKRDMRKKFVKSSRPTYKRRIRKGQVGMRFVSYVPVNNPTIDYTDITNPINPFSEYYIPTTYNTEQALVVPEREDSKSDTVEEIPVIASKPIAEPVVNKPVASKVVVNTANSTWSSPYKDKSKWAADLTNAYKRAGITNDNAIRMLVSQDALESAWGRSAQGKFNFGNLITGAKWKGDYVTGNDKNAKGEAIKQKFRSYNSMDEYAADKVQFLKRLYDFDENDDINKFVAKLTGSNKGKRRYAEARNYADTLKKVYNSYRSGGIIKYQNPAQPIKYMGGYDKRGNIVLPVTNENGMNNATLPEVTVTPRNINLAGAVDKGRREAAPYISTLLAGTMFGPLSVLGDAIGSIAVDEATRELSKGKYNTWGDIMINAGMNPVLAEFTNPGSHAGLPGFNKLVPRLKPVEDLAAIGNKWAIARVISKTIDKETPSVEPLPNNVGWGPRQSIHDTDAPTKLTLYNPERWDAVYEGAPEAGIWYQGKFGNPRTAANHFIPGKAENRHIK